MLAAVAILISSYVVVARYLEDRSLSERAVFVLLLATTVPIGIVEALGLFRVATPMAFHVVVLAFAAAALVTSRDVGLRTLRADRGTAIGVLAEAEPLEIAMGIAACAVFGLALLATYALDPWAWDALGYHLPYSDAIVQTGTIAAVPTSVTYVNAYPHLGAVFFTAWRFAFGDGFLEAAQMPFAALAVAGLVWVARTSGVSRSRALAVASLFVTVPGVMLQLAANYVDVMLAGLVITAFACLTVEHLDLRRALGAAIALGVTLGTKPSTPPLVAVGLLILLVRMARRHRALDGLLAAALALVIGSIKYVENILAYGNPIWPVRVTVGPITLPGFTTARELAQMGLREPLASLGWAGRIAESWLTPFAPYYVFDMRIGGFGPLFTFLLLPLGLATLGASLVSPSFRRLVRPIAPFTIAVLLLSLASPGAYWARYTLGVLAALLMLFALIGESLDDGLRKGLDALALALAVVGIGMATHGFAVDGPSITALAADRFHGRPIEYGIDLHEGPWAAMRARVGPGDAFSYDPSFGLPSRLFAHHQEGRVFYFDRVQPTDAELLDFVARSRSRAIVLGDGGSVDGVPMTGAEVARRHPERFRELTRCHPSLEAACVLFEVLD